MVTTLTLNPCIDKSVYIGEFQYGELNRVLEVREEIGGKGINVSKVLKNLGVETLCIGFNYEANGYKLEEELRNYEIDFDFVMARGVLRTNIKLYDSRGVMTELNESGGVIEENNVSELHERVRTALGKSKILVLSGSVPPGIDKNIYADLITLAKSEGVKTVLDADKDFFTCGLKSCPDIIKPNLYELESAFRVDLKTTKEITDFARGIINKGIKVVCVSLGGDGAIIVDEHKAFYAPALKLEAKGLTGAGDSIVAGICYALAQNWNLENTLRAAMAAAAGSVEKIGLLLCDINGFNKYFERVEIIKIN